MESSLPPLRAIKLSSNGCKSRVTLLIPDKHYKLLEKRRKRLKKNTAELLELLLKRHQRGTGWFWANRWKLPVLYQKKGLGLRRCDFSVDSFIWHEFKSLARFYNVSMCRLFVDFLKVFGTPKNNTPSLSVVLFEKLKIPNKTTLRLYKITDAQTPDTS